MTMFGAVTSAPTRNGRIAAESRQNRGGIACNTSARYTDSAAVLPVRQPRAAESRQKRAASLRRLRAILPLFCRCSAALAQWPAALTQPLTLQFRRPPKQTRADSEPRATPTQRAFTPRHTATTTRHADDAAARVPRTPQQASQPEFICSAFAEPTPRLHVVIPDRAPTAPPQPVRDAGRPEGTRARVEAAKIARTDGGARAVRGASGSGRQRLSTCSNGSDGNVVGETRTGPISTLRAYAGVACARSTAGSAAGSGTSVGDAR